jgi:hypothetical protein
VSHSEDSVHALLKRQLEPHGWRVGGPVAAENSSGSGATSTRERGETAKDFSSSDQSVLLWDLKSAAW